MIGMIHRKIIRLCTEAAVFSILVSCSLFIDYTPLTVIFPAGGSPWEQGGGVHSYLLVYPDPADDGKTLIRTEVETGKQQIVITIRKGSAVPVALYPNGSLKPAGGIYPLDLLNRSTLLLSEEDGFLVDILLDLHAENSRIEAVNIPKLKQVINENSEGDPWCIDGEILKTSLALGSLSVYKIKKKESRTIVISDVPGIWISDDPFYARAISDPDGILQVSLYPGMHAFLNLETQTELYVQVGTDSFNAIVKGK